MRLPIWLTNNLGLKLVSVSLALLIWIFVRVEEKGEVVIRMPVRFTNVPEQLVIVGDPVPEIQVVVEGPRTQLAQVEPGVLPYSIDLAEVDPGTHEFRIDPREISLPLSVHVVRILPSIIETTLEQARTYRLPVQARLTGTLAEGFEIAAVEIEPESVQLVAARGQLDETDALQTEPIALDGKKSDWSGIVQIELDGLDLKSVTTREAEVFVQILPKMVNREISGIPVSVTGFDGQLRTKPASVGVKVMGPENIVKRLAPDNIRGYVEVQRPPATTTQVPVYVDLPDQVVLISVNPARVSVAPAR